MRPRPRQSAPRARLHDRCGVGRDLLLANFSEQFDHLGDAERETVRRGGGPHRWPGPDHPDRGPPSAPRMMAERCRRHEAGGAAPDADAAVSRGDDPDMATMRSAPTSRPWPRRPTCRSSSRTARCRERPLGVDLLAELAETIPTIAYFKLKRSTRRSSCGLATWARHPRSVRRGGRRSGPRPRCRGPSAMMRTSSARSSEHISPPASARRPGRSTSTGCR